MYPIHYQDTNKWVGENPQPIPLLIYKSIELTNECQLVFL